MRPLRNYQVECVNQIRQKYREGNRSCCAVLPTGAGKTRIGTECAIGHLNRDGRTLWLAHRRELIAQAAERIRMEGVERGDIGVIVAGKPLNLKAPIQVASVQTLIERKLRPEASMVVFDECHHFQAETWRELADHYKDSWRLGLTATPERADGQPLGDIFTSLVAPVTVRQLIDGGWLVDCDVFAPLDKLKKQIAGDPIEQYQIHADGLQGFWYCRTIEEAEGLTIRVNKAGIPAACVTSHSTEYERDQALDGFRSGRIKALVNVNVFTEGTDVPEAACVVLNRGVGHAGLYLQMVGRVLRPHPGKTRAVVCDLNGVSRLFGHPTLDERTYSLNGKAIELSEKRRKRDAKKEAERIKKEQNPWEVVDEKLHEVKALDIDEYAKRMVRGTDAQVEFYKTMLGVAKSRGYRPGWATRCFVRRYGYLPWTRNGI